MMMRLRYKQTDIETRLDLTGKINWNEEHANE